MLDITIPSLPGGAAQLVRWLAAPGDTLAAGAPLAIVLTEQVEALLPAPGGVLSELAVAVGSHLEPGALLARVAEVSGDRGTGDRGAGRVWATPVARRMAAIHNIDLASVRGSGVDGRVMRADLAAAIGESAPADAEEPIHHEELERNGSRFSVLGSPPRGSQFSVLGSPPLAPILQPASIPVASATIEVDLSTVLEACAALAPALARLGLTVCPELCVARAAAELLPAHQSLNGHWSNNAMMLRRRTHLAIAVMIEPGAALRWGMVRDAADLNLRGLARAWAEGSAELNEATFSVVGLGAGAVWLNSMPPLIGTVAALTFGAAALRPVVRADQIVLRHQASLTLSYDARAVDHAQAVAFLLALREALEDFRFVC